MTPLDDDTSFATSADRKRAFRHLMLRDHGFLRTIWTHEYEIAPGVFRSNQPSPRRLAKLAARGIRSVLTLRGRDKVAPLIRLEREACRRLGLTFHHVPVGGGLMMPPAALIKLLDAFRIIEKPFVFHCKSGIDRTGLASFLYLLAETDTPPEVARRQLSLAYLHLKSSRHGILDVMADAYLDDYRATGIGIRAWIETDYNPDALNAASGIGAGA